jgi:Uma2 family endonuclease
MGMPAQEVARRWTREEVLALPSDGNRYELVDGDLLVSPTPRPLHQVAVSELSDLLKPYVRAHQLGALFAVPADLDLSSDQIVQPDLFVSTRRRILTWEEVGVPLLVVEVLSPSNARADRITKRTIYQRAGVPTLWIVDLDARHIEVWTPDAERPTIAVESLSWQPSAAVEALRIDLPRFFTDVVDG